MNAQTELRRRTMALIEAAEGKHHEPYKCPLGFWTVGIGHKMTRNEIRVLIDDNGQPRWPTTAETISLFFTQDFDEAMRVAQRLVETFDTLKPARQSALIECAFVLGGGRRGLQSFAKMLRAIRRKEWRRAAWELIDSRWHRQGLDNKLWGIVRRIHRLAMQIRTGKFQETNEED